MTSLDVRVVADPFGYHADTRAEARAVDYKWETAHEHCMQRQRCTGPGCNRRTGKTYRNRKVRNG